jgi:hypothetical protein
MTMPWINDTPHSIADKTVGPGSGAKKIGLHAKAKAREAKKAEKDRLKAAGIKPPPPVPPYQKALVRLKAGDLIIFTRPNLWTWDKTGGKIAPGVIDTLRSFKHLAEIEPGLLADQPGQVWGWSGKETND